MLKLADYSTVTSDNNQLQIPLIGLLGHASAKSAINYQNPPVAIIDVETSFPNESGSVRDGEM